MHSLFDDGYFLRTLLIVGYVWLNVGIFIVTTKNILAKKRHDTMDKLLYAIALFMAVMSVFIGTDMLVRQFVIVYEGK